MRRKSFVALLVLTLACSITVQAGAKRFDYPETRRVDVVDDYHGTPVADPYRWLEDDVRSSDELREWVKPRLYANPLGLL